MAKLIDIVQFANEYLDSARFSDYCPNGLQVQGIEEVKKIVSGVSCSLEFFSKAKDSGADLVLVHHGLIWGSQPLTITGNFGKRISYLIQNDISLLAYHLPLDAHNIVGNNQQVANRLNLTDREEFALYKGKNIGVIGYLEEAVDWNSFLETTSKVFISKPISYNFGAETIKKVAVVTGGAAGQIMDASDSDCDVFITGEVSESTLHLSKEEKINFIAAGHYNTEKFGVQALGDLLSNEMNIEHEFIDIPNAV